MRIRCPASAHELFPRKMTMDVDLSDMVAERLQGILAGLPLNASMHSDVRSLAKPEL